MIEDELLILSADTTTEKRSVAILRGDRVISFSSSDLRDSGAAYMLDDIASALAEASLKLVDIELFAVTTGPGSFTGLRSGLATLKAFAATLKKPLVGVPTLHAIGYTALPARQVVAMIPTGREEVFAQHLTLTTTGQIIENDLPVHISPDIFIERMARLGCELTWAGSGSIKFSELISEYARASGINFVSESAADFCSEVTAEKVWKLASPSQALAQDVGAIAKANFTNGAQTGADAIRALYVRQHYAENK